ncbi:hypothetical protein BGZ97_008705 [Linnemannia gamsii]|uniref:FAD-binding domain-containing protein n=1 Tax=Linnemannia gamsii TaxID=64522 RepID=A0A9P6UQ99_9FUNG|nr:hypothetical protein BGZ97_008705 [Linnemannia gamsii]
MTALLATSSQFGYGDSPRVLIVGAGLAGLFLGNLLEKANIPYEIFERAATIKPLGAIMCLHPGVMPAFEQLGIYEDLMSFSKLGLANDFYNDKLETIANMKASNTEATIGYNMVLFARPELYDLLFKRIPSHKIHMSKRLESFDQDHVGVRVQFTDGSIAKGDVLVGADGAYSGVRQHLYKTLDSQGLLPQIDLQSMSKGYISLIGTTDALDPSKYPRMEDAGCESQYFIGDGDTPYTWVTFTVPGNRICWNIVIQLGLDKTSEKDAKALDWESQDNKTMMDETRHFKTIYGTLGDLFDATPMERISKVYFEDKLFETWNHDRTVLIGDAAHKLLPSTGAGAVNAMQDAVILANRLYDIKYNRLEDVKAALIDYKEERFNGVKEQYPQSYISAKLLYGHTFWERVLRNVLFNWTPASVQRNQLLKDSAFRPQANFLPEAPKRGTVNVIPQKPSKRKVEAASV